MSGRFESGYYQVASGYKVTSVLKCSRGIGIRNQMVDL